MSKYILKRLLMMIPVVFCVAVLIFTIMYFTPGDPASIVLGGNASEIEVALKREEMGLNEPYLVQLGTYLSNTFLHFDLGDSWTYNTPVARELLNRLPRTMLIALICMILQVIIGIPLGVTAAVHQNGFADRFCMLVALIGVSIPGFWLGLMLVILFALKLEILPAYGIGGIQYYILPCIANALPGIAQQARQTRSSMLEVIRSDYITTARAKGISEREILYKHALPNGLIPVITVMGNVFGRMLAGTVVIESVFSIPGIGTYMTGAINSRDYPVIRGSVVFLAILFSLIMLLVDLVYAYVDPRIKAQYEGKKRNKKNGR
jgi:peptide/nickel transport system permease protein